MLSARFHLRLASRSISRHARRHHVAAPIQPSELNAIISHQPQPPPPANEDGDGRLDSSLLANKTIAIKDNIVTKDLLTTAASKVLSGYSSPFDATVVTLLRNHGAYISAKTNLDEFGMGSHSQHSGAGPVLSPFTRNGEPLSAGGSSGGSAVAVATGLCWAALGTDTGGSVRLPAAYTGVVGFKPSYGLLSRWGLVQYANSLDTVGILARRVEDIGKVFTTLTVFDKNDPTSLPNSLRQRMPQYNPSEQNKKKNLRIGVPREYNTQELSSPVRSAYTRTLQALQRAGHTLRPVSLPSTRPALSAYYILAPAEASSNLAKYDGVRYGHRTPHPDASPKSNLPLYAQTRGEAFGEEVKRRILLGAFTLSSEAIDNYFLQAQRIRRLVQRDFDAVFARPNPLLDASGEAVGEKEEGRVDVILTPTAPTLPPTLKEVARLSSVQGYMNDVFTVPASLAGLPAVSVPVALEGSEKEGLGEGDVGSVGVQVLAQFGDDAGALGAAEVVERLLGV